MASSIMFIDVHCIGCTWLYILISESHPLQNLFSAQRKERLLAIDAADPLQHLPGFIVITTIEEPHGTLLADCHFAKGR